MSKLDLILAGRRSPGLYRIGSGVTRASVERDAQEAGARFVPIDGRPITDKASFLRVVGQALSFPSYQGHNWDAFEESLNDLSWLPAEKYVLLLEELSAFAQAHPEEYTTALAILRDAAARWHTAGVLFVTLIRDGGPQARNLPEL